MSTYPIAVIVGSLREASINRRLADALVKLGPANFAFLRVEIGDLPLYNQDDDADPAESVKRLKSAIAGARGLIFVTPEYNRSMPGVLKNAIDHASRPYGKSAWTGKPRRFGSGSATIPRTAKGPRAKSSRATAPTTNRPRWPPARV